MPLVNDDLTYNRRAIIVAAWAEFRAMQARRSVRPLTFADALRLQWRAAKSLRARMADGTIARERREREARESRYAAMACEPVPAGVWAGIMRECATDGRLSRAGEAR